MSQLLTPFHSVTIQDFESSWTSPANIAFVKYWGKKSHQIPANPSLSMTLSECTTTTKTKFQAANGLSVRLKLNGKSEEKFATKIKDYLESLQDELPWILNLSVEIETSNTFPHGAGIASSASGLSAFALTLTEFLTHLKSDPDEALFLNRASYLSRLASGSACRSVYGGFTSWGDSALPDSSDLFATSFTVHPELASLNDTVLVINSEEKTISSRSGHGRMNEHFFAEARYSQARDNFSRCISALQRGEMDDVGIILEAEALALHAMMLTSPEPYTLLNPNTLSAINAIWDFRKETKLPLYFTLDAGPNLHLIYPEAQNNKITTFISHELTPLAENIIHDKTGIGPKKC